jgi:pimeloyl-ACP methyl ester carboxylesterase
MVAGGCHLGQPVNPAFDVTRGRADSLLEAMADDPKPFARPVVVLSGWLDPGLAEWEITSRLRRVTGPRQKLIGVTFFGASDFDECRTRVLEAVKQAVPAAAQSDAEKAVDVVAYSMGGVVARHAARPIVTTPWGPKADGPRLAIKRLFTISSPHRGASLAKLPSSDPLISGMAPGSPFLKKLNRALPEADYQIIPYVRLGDGIVGSHYARPGERPPWWVPTPVLQSAHLGAHKDPRIVADIARRLRGEAPLTDPPPVPLPPKYREP